MVKNYYKKRKGIINCNEKGELYKEEVDIHNSDIIGRFLVKIGNKEYDTIRQIYFNSHNELVENYINTEGEIVLFRRFNRYDWRYKKAMINFGRRCFQILIELF